MPACSNFPVWSLSAALALMVGVAPAASGAAEATAVEQGLRIMNDMGQGNCVTCHLLPGQAGLQGNFGPPLAGVGSRWSADQLRQWVTDARVLRPHTLMPPFGTVEGLQRIAPVRPVLTPAQIELVVSALQSLR